VAAITFPTSAAANEENSSGKSVLSGAFLLQSASCGAWCAGVSAGNVKLSRAARELTLPGSAFAIGIG
jgi:hypothetical protein